MGRDALTEHLDQQGKMDEGARRYLEAGVNGVSLVPCNDPNCL